MKKKNKRKPIWLGSSGDNLRSTGEYIGHNFLNWKEPRIPSSSPPSITKINLQFVDDLKICNSWVLYVHYQVINFWTAAASSSAKENLATWEKQNTMAPKWNLLAYPPLCLVCFFRPQTFSRMVDRFFTQTVCVLHASIFESAKSEKVALAGFAGHSWLLCSLGVPHSGG